MKRAHTTDEKRERSRRVFGVYLGTQRPAPKRRHKFEPMRECCGSCHHVTRGKVCGEMKGNHE